MSRFGFGSGVRAIKLVTAFSLLLGACAGIHTLPKQQASRDLDCPEEKVRVTTAHTTQYAEGCHRSATYEWKCGEDGESCEWVQKGSIVVKKKKPPGQNIGLGPRESDAVPGQDAAGE